jgi:acylphosphatase
MRALRIYVSGRVQGVGYRYYAKQSADQLDVKGWARNLPDGRVEVLAQFPDDQTEKQFIEMLEEGPGYGSVSGLEIIPEKRNEIFDSFQITF